MVPFESLGTVSFSHSIATMAVSLTVSAQYTNVTDRDTDTQLDTVRRRTSRLCIASRVKKINVDCVYEVSTYSPVAGTLAPSLVMETEPNTSSIDVIFATYWFYPAKTKAILPEDQRCIDDMMNKQEQRFDVHSE